MSNWHYQAEPERKKSLEVNALMRVESVSKRPFLWTRTYAFLMFSGERKLNALKSAKQQNKNLETILVQTMVMTQTVVVS